MKKNKDHNDFHAVEFMRERREALSDLYNRKPAEFRKELETIRKKYGSKFRRKIKKAA
jgi:hypothetical protein